MCSVAGQELAGKESGNNSSSQSAGSPTGGSSSLWCRSHIVGRSAGSKAMQGVITSCQYCETDCSTWSGGCNWLGSICIAMTLHTQTQLAGSEPTWVFSIDAETCWSLSDDAGSCNAAGHLMPYLTDPGVLGASG